LRGLLAEDEDHDGDTGAGRKGNTHVRVCLWSQRNNQPGFSVTAGASARGFTNFSNDNPNEYDCSVIVSTRGHNQALENPDDNEAF
jgi:hypothetical protein